MNSTNVTTAVPPTHLSGAATSSGTLIFAASILFLLTLFAGTLPVMLIECLSKRINSRKQSATSATNGLTVASSSSDPSISAPRAHRSLSSKLSNIFVKDRIVQFLAQLGGGVLLYTSLIHMLPEIREDYEKYKSSHHAPPQNESLFQVAADVVEEHSEDLPLVDLCSLAGFFAIFLIEELMHTFVMKNHDHHGHGGEEETRKVTASTSAKNGHQNLTRRLSGVKQAYMDHKRVKAHYQTHVNEHETVVAVMTTASNGNTLHAHNYGNGSSLVTSGEMLKSNGKGSDHMAAETAPITSIYQPHRCYDACSDESHCVDMAIDRIVRRCDVENVSNFEAVINEDRTIFARILDALLMILAFSCHAVFDGISIGVQTGSRVWTVLIAILTHKLLIAFILSVQIYERCFQKVVKPAAGADQLENGADGLPMQRKPMKRAKPILWMFSTIFALMSPIGIVIVLAFNGNEANADDKPLHLILLAAFSAGTIIYICFLEIIDKSSSRTHISGFVQWLALVTGFGLMHLISTLFHE